MFSRNKKIKTNEPHKPNQWAQKDRWNQVVTNVDEAEYILVMGIIAHKDGNKAGFIGMLLGILGLIGNIVFIIIIFGNH